MEKAEEEQTLVSALLNNQEGFVVPIEKFVTNEVSETDLSRCDVVYVSGYNPKVSEIYDVSVDEICD
jgi:hypothetical protein